MADIVPHPCLAAAVPDERLLRFIVKLENAVICMGDVQRQSSLEEARVLALVYAWAAVELRAVKGLDDPIIHAVLRLIQALPRGVEPDTDASAD